MLFLKIILKYCFPIGISICLFSSQTLRASENYKNILLINSYHIGYPWTDSITAGVISVINETDNVALYIEHLDGKRFEDTSYFRKLANLYHQKYKMGLFDLVILSDNLALEFSLKYGKFLYGDIPVVYCGVGNPNDYNLANIPYYGVLESQSDIPVLKLINSIIPNLKNVYVISDKTQNGILTIQRKKILTQALPANVNCVFIDDIDLESLFSKVQTFQKTDAILLISLQRDTYGKPLNYSKVTSKLCSLSPVPVFCNYFANLGKGVVGGCLDNAHSHGRIAARIALGLLFDPKYKPIKLLKPESEYYFDFKVLERFNISLNSLPIKSHIINMHENIFKKYKILILTTLGVIILLISIIALMYKNIIQQKKIEQITINKNIEIQQQSEVLAITNQNLNDTNAELESINETLNSLNEELYLAKEHAEESDRLKTAFLHNMSHEIRTPMNAIMGFSSLLALNYNDKQKLEKFSGIINSRCIDLLEIINDILDIAKIESGQLSINTEVCDVKELFVELFAFFSEHQIRLGKENIEFNTFFTGSTPDLLIETDKVKLKQVLINLLGNAFKFTDIGTISVGCKFDTHNKLLFYVSDTGIGIPADKQASIFDRFVQVTQDSNRFYGGTGLGLSIVKGLIDILGGDVWLESKLGEGSTFYFTIPLKRVQTLNNGKEFTIFSGESDFSTKTLLLVEDDEYNTEYIKEILQSAAGLKVIHTGFGKEAVQISQKENIDLVLMDIRLPDIDGYEATKQIREHKPFIKIIAQTAYASQIDKQKAIDSGCDDYLSKPTSRDVLLKMLNKYLSI
jgi:signal transduction histidine kinase/CheY-like chemotaxis protein